MKRKKVPSILILILLVCLISGSAASSASDEETSAALLQGLPGVLVVVEDLPPQLREKGVSEEQLKAHVEEQLKGGGINVLSLTEYFRTSHPCTFSVGIRAFIGRPGPLITSIVAELNQGVYLERDPKIHEVLATWSEGFVGSIGSFHLEEVFVIVGDLVDQFINAYLLANGKGGDEKRKIPRSGYDL